MKNLSYYQKFKCLYVQSLPKSISKNIIGFNILLMLLGILIPFPKVPKHHNVPLVFNLTEHYTRFIPTILSVAVPLAKRDVIGLFQVANASIATTILTHTQKRALNDVTIYNQRLGERPYGGNHNMPSGHSSMIGLAVAFLMRRYSFKGYLWLFPLVPLTMLARIYLDMHTIGAVLAGLGVGILCASLFTSPKKS
ncbi:lipid A 1-phosphatase LpxE [Helicobacter cetorum]|uniref:Lipid A 1-phosphatase n=1 Tax=Helicobacter cetorum (strain ATCC BAA-429 / MIT 00-7128) TaxID=182217 RepID=I0EK80_HELC0|nr:lipid A 1-phosphatase LpxE [Helicobacter cetorum]AFI03349.1 lipid A 1-phosphatase [Helicobacter cetorum MIT 00-7128]